MLLSDFSIKRPIVTVVVAIALMAVGWMALSKLRVNERPDITPPILQVDISYPGASPETVEREILDRLEKSMRGIPGVHELRAWANEGGGVFRIEFEFNKNLIEATDDVRNSIASVRYKLPHEMREPIIRKEDADAWPIMTLSLSSSSQSHMDLSVLAEKEISDRLRGIPGVAVINVSGELKRELSVLLRSEKLRMHNISVAEVQNALLNHNLTAPSGKLQSDLEDRSIRLLGRLKTPEDFSQIMLKRNGNKILRLGDVADVVDGNAQPQKLSYYNGHLSVGIIVVRTRDASTVAVSKLVRKELDEIRKQLKPGTVIEVVQDGGEMAEQSLNNVIEALILGAGLTIFVVYAFLNSWRSTLITALALPTSVLAAFIAVWIVGLSLNFMTLLGLSLAIGVLIDDAIVVRENIVRHMELGKDRITASREGTREIGMAVMATTFSIVAVFVPVIFISGGPGQWSKPFALTVVASVLVSLFISFSLDPMLSSRWGDPVGYQHAAKRGISSVLKQFNTWFDHQADRYSLVIRWALGNRRAIAIISIASLIAAITLQLLKGGTSFLPAGDNGRLVIDIRLPSGASLEYARAKTEQAAEFARNLPEIKSVYSDIGRDNSRLSLDVGMPSERHRDAASIAKELRASMSRLVGAEYAVQDDTSNGSDKPLRINFYGQDSRKLMEITESFMIELRKLKGAVDVGIGEQDAMPELQIELNRSVASSLGISVSDVSQTLRLAFAGDEIGDWIDPAGETRDVTLRLHPDDRTDLAALARVPLLVSGSNSVIPLEQIATIFMGKAPARITHIDGKRTLSVTSNVEGAHQGDVINQAVKLAASIDFPPGYGIQLGGAGKDQNEVFSAMFIALISGIVLMYFILVVQFNSFLAPVAVLMSLPLSLIGVVIALVSTGHTLNLMSFIGIIMLMGLVAKNAILLLDCAREKEKEGFSREDALMYAGRSRFRPILMTTFALIAGMLPIAIGMGEGGKFYQPLAVAIIGGTITSTILTLLMIPTFYDSIEIASERLVAKYNRRAEQRGTLVSTVFTAVEVILTLIFLRLIYRSLMRVYYIRRVS